MLKETVRKMLKKMACDVTGKPLTAIGEEEAIEVTDAILAAVEEALPKEREYLYKEKISDDLHSKEVDGFNACLAEIKSTLKGN